MIKPKPGIFVRFLLVSSLAVSAALLYFYLVQFLPSRHKLMESQLVARARAVCDLSSRSLIRALETRDDLALIGTFEDMKKLDDVSSVYILDASGKVLAHDRVGEWNKTYVDPVSRKALAAKGRYVQRTAEPSGYLFSIPLSPRAVLCLGLSSQKMDESLALARRDALYSGLTVFILIMLVLAGFMYYVPGARLGKLKERLVNTSSGQDLPVDASDELGELTRAINELMHRINADRVAGVQRADETVRKLNCLFRSLVDRMNNGIMALDADNRIIAVNDAFRDRLLSGSGDVAGKHFLEAVRSDGLIELVKHSSLEPNRAIEGKIDGSSVKVITVADPVTAAPAGIIIVL